MGRKEGIDGGTDLGVCGLIGGDFPLTVGSSLRAGVKRVYSSESQDDIVQGTSGGGMEKSGGRESTNRNVTMRVEELVMRGDEFAKKIGRVTT